MEIKFEGTGAPRCGTVNWSKGEVKKEISFPACLVSTNAGSIPHLTSETYSYIPKKLQPSLINIPVPSVIEHEDAIFSYPGSMTEFFNQSPNSVMLVATKDALPRMRGNSNPTLNTAKAVSVWGNSGRLPVDSERHVNLIAKLKPDFFEILADGDTAGETVSKKRISKSFTNSLKFLKESLEIIMENTELEDSYIIPALEGGNNAAIRKEYTNATLNLLHTDCTMEQVIGFLIDGIRRDSSTTVKLANASVMGLPENKLRFMFGPRSPHEVLELLDIGIDIFDSSYPIIQAQKNCAVTFHIPKLETLSSPNTRKPAHDALDVSDESNRLLFEPLLEGCQCYTCHNHTKAYIYHLVSVKELLAPILLTLHNLHHYFKFFDVLREAIKEGKYDEFKSEMLSSNLILVPPKNST